MILLRITIFISLILVSACSIRDPLPFDSSIDEIYTDTALQSLARAAYKNDIKSLRSALADGADPNVEGRYEVSPIKLAYWGKSLEAFEILLENNADSGVFFDTGESLLGLVILERKTKFLEILLKYDADVNIRNSESQIPAAFRAITDDRSKTLERLISHGLEVNIQRPDSSTLAVYSSNTRQMRILKYLIENGADPLIQNDAGMDVAAGLFGPNWDTNSESYRIRASIIEGIESEMGLIPDEDILIKSQIANYDEATGKVPPKWLLGQRDPNPEWVKHFPIQAEQWYQSVRGTRAPQ